MRRFYLYREADAHDGSGGHADRLPTLVLIGEGVLFRNGAVALANGPCIYDSLERMFEVFRTRILRFLDGEQPEPRSRRVADVGYRETAAASLLVGAEV